MQTKEKKLFTEKELFKENGERRIKQKEKEGSLTGLVMAIRKDPTTSIGKHVNELKVHKKNVRTAIKQDLRPDHNLLNYVIWDVLKNKTKATSHRNMGSFKIAIKEE